MVNILAALLQGLAGQAPPTEIDGLDIVASRKPSAAPMNKPMAAKNPFTDDYIAAAQAAAMSGGKLPRVSGGTDAGLYGFLPQKMQNGRLRDVLGAIGDGILLGGGNKPIYQPRKDARLMGQALIGYDQNPMAAAERLAQTGAPESIDTARAIFGTAQTSEDKAAQRELMQTYYQTQLKSKNDAVFQRLGPSVTGVMGKVSDIDSYIAAYKRLDMMAKRIDPEADPTTAWGLPDPVDWTPEATEWVGTTGGQRLSADVSRERIEQSDVNNRRTTSTSSANNQRSTATSSENNKRTTAQSNTNSERAASNKAKNKTSSGGLNARTAGGKPSGAKVVTNGDVAYLRANPSQRAAFDKHFGAGSAKKYLGK